MSLLFSVHSKKLPFFKDNESLDAQFNLFEAFCMDFKSKSQVSLQGNKYILLVKEVKGRFSFKLYFPSREAQLYVPWVVRVFALFERQTGAMDQRNPSLLKSGSREWTLVNQTKSFNEMRTVCGKKILW